MKVSVVIPVLNGQNYIADAIESVLKQDYKDIDLVVCDGESTDSTRKIAEAYKVKIVQGKLGLVPNWRCALEAATGDYVKILCHDDTLEPDCISKQAKELDEDPEIIMVSGPRQYIDKDGKKIEPNMNGARKKIKGIAMAEFMLQYGNIVGETSCTLFRNTKITFPENLNWLCDMYMWIQLFSKGDFLFIPEKLVNIRKHDEQDTFRVLADPNYGAKEASDKQHIYDFYCGMVA